MNQPKLKVFVYGTLKPGEVNYTHYCDRLVKSQTIAYTKGILYHLSVGYPAMTEGDNHVKGFLLTLTNSSILSNLDLLEDYQAQRASDLNEYYRRLVRVYSLEHQLLGKAWAYFMSPQRVKQYRGIIVPSGWWSSK